MLKYFHGVATTPAINNQLKAPEGRRPLLGASLAIRWFFMALGLVKGKTNVYFSSEPGHDSLRHQLIAWPGGVRPDLCQQSLRRDGRRSL